MHLADVDVVVLASFEEMTQTEDLVLVVSEKEVCKRELSKG